MWDNIIMICVGLFVVALLIIAAFSSGKKQDRSELTETVPAAITHRCRFKLYNNGHIRYYRCKVCDSMYGKSRFADGWRFIDQRLK